MLQCLPYGMVSPPLNISCCKIRHFHPAFMLGIVFNFFFWHEEFVCKDSVEKAVSNFCILYSKSFQNWTNKPGHTNYRNVNTYSHHGLLLWFVIAVSLKKTSFKLKEDFPSSRPLIVVNSWLTRVCPNLLENDAIIIARYIWCVSKLGNIFRSPMGK